MGPVPTVELWVGTGHIPDVVPQRVEPLRAPAFPPQRAPYDVSMTSLSSSYGVKKEPSVMVWLPLASIASTSKG